MMEVKNTRGLVCIFSVCFLVVGVTEVVVADWYYWLARRPSSIAYFRNACAMWGFHLCQADMFVTRFDSLA